MRFDKIYCYILLLSLMISLSSSSFFLADYLTQQLHKNNYHAGQFSYALKHDYIAAITIAEKTANIASTHWLTLNQTLAKSQKNAALKLAYWYQKKAQQEDNIALVTTAIMWFEQAIRLQSQQAMVALAQLYFQQGKFALAQTTLGQLPAMINNINLAETHSVLAIKIAVSLGDVALVKQLVNSTVFKQEANSKIQPLLAQLDKYAVIKDSPLLISKVNGQVQLPFEALSSCITSLQLFATNLEHLKHLEQLINSFNEQQVLAQYVCLPIPRYISRKRLDCQAHAQQAIYCNEAHWQSVAKDVTSRHIGLMLNEGGANVHLGILYFDVEDNADVFSHEISHLLGFVDEYPLSKNHDKCQGVQHKPFAHNIAVLANYYQGERKQVRARVLAEVAWASKIKASTPILQAVDENFNEKIKWRLGTPIAFKEQVGLYLAESCQQSSTGKALSASHVAPRYSAFKPLNRRTQLRYFANEFPQEYLNILKAKPFAYLMPSFHYNIALALYQQGDIVGAKFWLAQAAVWESEALRKARILSGSF
ncbi:MULTISPECIES: hypothetical protein [Colwellia]|uniref:Uncharacterized protein n=1 Tax=Colwellia marinimaniae TaxID=1513592 RepID=A0ABQ0MS63_9GAMM|nr:MULTISPECIES: hypothetical protein [Colwellia]GAW95202.1 hypothetical protein MTCD1_00801 [Colwellia marinimaniae]